MPQVKDRADKCADCDREQKAQRFYGELLAAGARVRELNRRNIELRRSNCRLADENGKLRKRID